MHPSCLTGEQLRALRERAGDGLPRPHRQETARTLRRLAAAALALSVWISAGSPTLSALLAVPRAAAATGIHKPINYQGKITLQSGVAPADGSYNMRFKIFTGATLGSPVWTETWNGSSKVSMTGGLFSVPLGSITAMTGSVNFNSDNLYLQVEFDADDDESYAEVFSPRRRFGSVPYAHNADKLDGLDSTQFVRTDTGSTITAGTLKILNPNVGLRVSGTASGDVLHAERLLTTSGAVVVEGDATFDADTLFVDSALNRVGIGTTDPETELEVVGTVSGSTLTATDAISTAGTLTVGGTVTLNGVTYTFPASDGTASGKVLATDGFGTLSWTQMSGGISEADGDARYVNVAGDTMTGALTVQGLASFDTGVVLGTDAASILTVRGTFSGSLIPNATNTYDLGSSAYRWRDLYLSGGTLHMGASGNEAVVGYNSASNYFKIDSNADGTSDMVVLSTGNVGIGTAAPDTKLEVAGTMSGGTLTVQDATSAFDDPVATFRSPQGTRVTVMGPGTTQYIGYQFATPSDAFRGGMILEEVTKSLQFYTDSSATNPPLSIEDSTGYVGIGTGANLQAKLHILRSGGSALRLDGGTFGGAYMDIVRSGDTSEKQIGHANSVLASNVLDSDALAIRGDAGIQLSTSSNGANGITILSTGNVGIGTASPTSTLHLLSAGDVSGNNAGLRIGNSYGGSTKTWNITVDNGYSKGLNFGEPGVADGRLFLQQGGNVGIGTTAPDTKLDVVGTISGSLITQNGAGNNYFMGSLGVGTMTPDIYGRGYGGTILGISGAGNSALVINGGTSAAHLEMGVSGTRYLSITSESLVSTIGTNTAAPLSLSTNNTEKVRIDSTGNVGIGTTSPTAKLHVLGGNLRLDSAAGNNSVITYGENGTPKWDMGSTTSTNAFQFYKYTGGNGTVMTLLNSGNVGIGTTSPDTKFDVVGTISGSLLYLGPGLASAPSLAFNGDTNTGLYWGGADTLKLVTGGSDRLTIDSSGNVGIGTTGPAEKLSVTGNIGMTSGADRYVGYDGGDDSVGFNNGPGGGVRVDVANVTGVLSVLRDSTPVANTLVLKSGKVGIGTTGPSALLHVYKASGGATTYVESADSYAAQYIRANNNDSWLLVQNVANSNSWYTGMDYSASEALKIGFRSGAGGQPGDNDLITVLTTGNVGIGTTSPSERVHASGAILLDMETATSTRNVFKIVSDVASNEDTAFRIQANGATFSDNAYSAAGADYAEWFRSSTPDLGKEELVCIDVSAPDTVRRCDRDGDANVMGIVSSSPAFVGNMITGADGLPVPGYVLVGLIGQVKTKVIDEAGPIHPGDSLAPASVPGYARKAKAGEPTVGVALQPHASGRGRINVLISRRNQSLTVDMVEDRILASIRDMEVEDRIDAMLGESVRALTASGAALEQSLTAKISQLDIKTKIREVLAEMSGALLAPSSGTVAFSSGASLQVGDLGVAGAASFSGTLRTHGTLTADALVSEKTLMVAGDTSIGGDLYLAGMLKVEELFVPGIVRIDGGLEVGSLTATTGSMSTLSVEKLTAGSGSRIEGTLIIDGRLELGSGSLSLGTGSAVEVGSLTANGGLHVLGDVTIAGLATFLGDVSVQGQLIVSNRQAGYAQLPLGGTGVTVRFDPALSSQPVVTVTPRGRVGGEWWTEAESATGFRIRVENPLAEGVDFSWTALVVAGTGSSEPVGEGSSASSDPSASASSASGDLLPFYMDENGVPLTGNAIADGCLRNAVPIDDSGRPYSCSRYHVGPDWDVDGLQFEWNTLVEPPRLTPPEGYTVVTVRAAPQEGVPEEQPVTGSGAGTPDEALGGSETGTDVHGEGSGDAANDAAPTALEGDSGDLAEPGGDGSLPEETQAASTTPPELTPHAPEPADDSAQPTIPTEAPVTEE